MRKSRTTPENGSGDHARAFKAKIENGQRVVSVERPNCIQIKWTRHEVGLGDISLKVKGDGLHVNSDGQGATFVKEIISLLIDEADADGRLK